MNDSRLKRTSLVILGTGFITFILGIILPKPNVFLGGPLEGMFLTCVFISLGISFYRGAMNRRTNR